MTAVVTPATRYLVPLSGPPLKPIELKDCNEPQTAGRHEKCELLLPADAEQVSRFHARFDLDEGHWRVTDLGSRWGTYVNGVKLEPQAVVPLRDGDLIRITPWTFSLSQTPKRRTLQAADDSNMTQVRTVPSERQQPLADAMLSLLLESTAGLHAAHDEKQLAELLIDVAMRGTGFQNAAVLRPVDAGGGLEIIASKFVKAGAPNTFSRSLIAAAETGNVAEINTSAGGAGNISTSMVQLNISSAICVPLRLGTTVAAFLYLDSRGTLTQTVRPTATSFCVALGKMASLAFANLKRVEMEKRDAAMRAELAAAATAQRWIMPRREGKFGAFRTIGESKPGQYVGGDFFDIIQLDPHRVAVAVADVSGKGVAASVLMTATQGFLNSSLRECANLGEAVTHLNQFVNPRRPENRFVTAWVGVFDSNTNTLSYVDAGHSYALLQRADGNFEQLDKGGGLPIGVMEDYQYTAETIELRNGDQVAVVSDGIVEQPAPGGGDRDQFEVAGLQRTMAGKPADTVAALFAAVIAHAGSDKLADDATAVLVKFE